MRRLGLMLVAVVLTGRAFASVSPDNPTTSDNVVYLATFGATCGFTITTAREGHDITISMDSTSTLCLGVPATYRANLGILPAGTYNVRVNIYFAGKLDSSVADSFTVTKANPIPVLDRTALAVMVLVLAALGVCMIPKT